VVTIIPIDEKIQVDFDTVEEKLGEMCDCLGHFRNAVQNTAFFISEEDGGLLADMTVPAGELLDAYREELQDKDSRAAKSLHDEDIRMQMLAMLEPGSLYRRLAFAYWNADESNTWDVASSGVITSQAHSREYPDFPSVTTTRDVFTNINGLTPYETADYLARD
jgi:hypothetical protein